MGFTGLVGHVSPSLSCRLAPLKDRTFVRLESWSHWANRIWSTARETLATKDAMEVSWTKHSNTSSPTMELILRRHTHMKLRFVKRI